MKFNRCRIHFVAALALAAVLSNGQAADPVIERIIDEGKSRNQVMTYLKQLCEGIGPRVTGSPELERAQDWAVKKFQGFGLTNARLEQWGEVPVGFTRGKRQVGRMVTPFKADFVFTTMNWMPGTNGLVRGKAVEAPKTVEQVTKMAKALKGAWVLTEWDVTMRGPQNKEAKDLFEAVNAAGIAGRVFSSKNELVHSHGSFREKTFERRPKDVQVVVRKSDMERIKRNMAKGPVELEFDIENKWIKGPIPQYNVIADIVGTEKPDEMVIVCGHFDSWNTPGSQGANDNGTGSVVAMEAARLLAKVGARPKRTIRFILWSGEEQGLLGSFAYVDKYKADMAKISAVINDDGGTGYHGGYEVTKEMEPMMKAAVAPIQAAFPELAVEIKVVDRIEGGGSDHVPFLEHGVPGLDTMEGGDADYRFVWHTQNDRVEMARPNYLIQSATDAAAVAYYLANAPTLLPRPVPLRP